MTNRETFAQTYTEILTKLIEKHPEEYAYPVSEVPGVVAKMIPAFVRGEAAIEKGARATARKLGIKPNKTAICAFLSGR
jgi:hypothetical protein